MSDIIVLTALVRTTLKEVAKQSSALGAALQNAAPGDKVNSPNQSIQYLLAIADELEVLVERCDELLQALQSGQSSSPTKTIVEKEKRDVLLQIMEGAVQRDSALRAELNVGMKFRFTHDKLQTLLAQVKEALTTMQEEADEEEKEVQVEQDETVVFVHLYNVQGMVLTSWKKMVIPKVFYEHSINRPIYIEREHVMTFIKNKSNFMQHGYLAVAVKNQDIIKPVDPVNDNQGNPIIKVREGSLRYEKLLAFVHNDIEYRVTEAGELERKI